MKPSDTVTLPRSGLSLTRLGMGCAAIGGLYQRCEAADARLAIDAAWELGLRYFDTAPFYGYTLSEHRLGEAMRERPRAQFTISSKVGRLMQADGSVRPGDDGWAAPLPFRPHYDYTYEAILQSHQDSLQRLGIECIDILFVHDIGEVTHGALHEHYWQQLTKGGGFRALEQLRRDGQVKALGLGVNEAGVVHQAMQECDLDCTLLAGRYTLLEQASLSPLLDACVKQGNAIIVGGPFNSGVLAGNGKFNYADAPQDIMQRVAQLKAVCEQFGVPLQAAALQFPMAHPAVVSIIPGGQDVAQLRQNAAWFEQAIPAGLWQALLRAGLIDERAPVPLA